VVSPKAVMQHFEISDTTLATRRPGLEELGVHYRARGGRGNAHGYGTEEQWAAEGRAV
jgi:hypothetical protein